MSRVLVTTTIEETWPEGEPILFLGEWCRRFSQRDRWSGLDAEVVNYHWDNQQRAFDDSKYLRELHTRLLENLAADLNELHDTDHSLRYWRILVGPWLRSFVAILRDKWLSVEEAVENHDISWTFVLNQKESDLSPDTYFDFMRLMVKEEWNHYLYSVILDRIDQVDLHRRDRCDSMKETSTTVRPSKPIRVKTWMWETLSRFSTLFTREDDVVIVGSFLPFRKEIALQLRFRQLPLIWHLVPWPDLEFKIVECSWTMSGTATHPFEQLVREMIPRQIPSAYSGGYQVLQDAVGEMSLPTRPRLIFTSNKHIYDDLFKAWAALSVETGAKLVVGQHGGGYGIYQYSMSVDHEVEISDAFLSWGWEDPADSRVIPVGQLLALKPSGVVHAQQKTALLVGYVDPRHSRGPASVPTPSQHLFWFQDQMEFVEALPENIRSELLVRLYPLDLGWDQVERWQDRCPDVTLNNSEHPGALVDLLSQTRVFIASCNATSFLESFAMDVPTIMFWNPDHWELSEGVSPFFKSLVEAGILHYSPTSAAHKLSEIWDDVDRWWSSDLVTVARTRFCDSYNQSPPDLVSKVARALKNALHAPQQSSSYSG